jgi:hypothetical protein
MEYFFIQDSSKQVATNKEARPNSSATLSFRTLEEAHNWGLKIVFPKKGYESSWP